MKSLTVLLASISIAVLSSCGSGTVPQAKLSASEQSLLTSINSFRASQGKKALQASASLTQIAREDAVRRATTGQGYVDIRKKTGYERMLTLSGKAVAGDQFGSQADDCLAGESHPKRVAERKLFRSRGGDHRSRIGFADWSSFTRRLFGSGSLRGRPFDQKKKAESV